MPFALRIRPRDLRSLARQKIADHRLPVKFGRPRSGGYGSGATLCDLCEQPIERCDVQYQVSDPRNRLSLSFHVPCHVAWKLACDAPTAANGHSGRTGEQGPADQGSSLSLAPDLEQQLQCAGDALNDGRSRLARVEELRCRALLRDLNFALRLLRTGRGISSDHGYLEIARKCDASARRLLKIEPVEHDNVDKLESSLQELRRQLSGKPPPKLVAITRNAGEFDSRD
jgi:hypothetical protein